MSKQLAISSAISVMIMAAFVLYAPGLIPHAGSLPQAGLHLPQVAGFKALLSI
jgi:hypothetical protein